MGRFPSPKLTGWQLNAMQSLGLPCKYCDFFVYLAVFYKISRTDVKAACAYKSAIWMNFMDCWFAFSISSNCMFVDSSCEIFHKHRIWLELLPSTTMICKKLVWRKEQKVVYSTSVTSTIGSRAWQSVVNLALNNFLYRIEFSKHKHFHQSLVPNITYSAIYCYYVMFFLLLLLT